MTREMAAALMLALLLVLLVLMWRGWRRRTGRYQDLPALTRAEAVADGPLRVFHLLYVATTEMGAPLERIAKRPLAFRSKVDLGVGASGVWLDIPGEDPVVIETAALRGVGRATWTIDRVVDSDGLVMLRWQWGPRTVESYFRSVDYPADELVVAISHVIDNKEEL